MTYLYISPLVETGLVAWPDLNMVTIYLGTENARNRDDIDPVFQTTDDIYSAYY